MNIGKLMEYQYELKAKFITRFKLLRALALFRKNILRGIPHGYSIGLQLKVRMDTDYRSISSYSVIRVEDFIKLLPNWLISVDLRSDIYNQYGVSCLMSNQYLLNDAQEIFVS